MSVLLTGIQLLFLEQNAQMRTTRIVMGKTLYVVTAGRWKARGMPTFLERP
jgi:hypothetical protein